MAAAVEVEAIERKIQSAWRETVGRNFASNLLAKKGAQAQYAPWP